MSTHNPTHEALTKALHSAQFTTSALREAHSAAIDAGHNLLEVVLLAQLGKARDTETRLEAILAAFERDHINPKA